MRPEGEKEALGSPRYLNDRSKKRGEGEEETLSAFNITKGKVTTTWTPKKKRGKREMGQDFSKPMSPGGDESKGKTT